MYCDDELLRHRAAVSILILMVINLMIVIALIPHLSFSDGDETNVAPTKNEVVASGATKNYIDTSEIEDYPVAGSGSVEFHIPILR